MRVLPGHNLLLETIKSDGELPGIRIHLSMVGALDRKDGRLTRNRIRGMQEGKIHRALDIVFAFSAALIDRCTRNKLITLLTKICARYSDIVCVVNGVEG